MITTTYELTLSDATEMKIVSVANDRNSVIELEVEGVTFRLGGRHDTIQAVIDNLATTHRWALAQPGVPIVAELKR